jgi:cation diffusion facilitator CzcD-associated flavoprotein CzcO
VTAKTLVHNYPKGTFEPIIFEKRRVIGGLWPVRYRGDDHDKPGVPGFVSPQMRTNLSRFTVSFSDLSWESVLGDDVPMFPRASQVGKYLETYVQCYIPPEVLKLGCKVVSSERRGVDGEGGRWRVEWEEVLEGQEADGK